MIFALMKWLSDLTGKKFNPSTICRSYGASEAGISLGKNLTLME
jgi:hypothetical protein